MAFARIALVLCAVPFAGPGLYFLVSPDSAARVVDITLESPLGRSDARAVFGALELALFALLAAAAFRRDWIGPGLLAAAVLYGALVLARTASLALDGSPGPTGFALLAPEVAGLLLALIARARWARHSSER